MSAKIQTGASVSTNPTFQLQESEHFTTSHLIRLRDSLTRQEVVCGGTVKITAPESELRLFFKNSADGIDGAAHFLQLPTSSPKALEPLLAACLPASFGINNQDVLDSTYRNALCLNTSDFAINFSPEKLGILQQIEDVLVGDAIVDSDVDKDDEDNTDRSENWRVYAEIYKLNVYATGGFFKEHKDTPRARNMFGSLVVCFPTAHTGGELVLKEENGRKHTYNWSQDAPTSTCQWVAFYSEITHEILPVMSGHRLTLTYNLYFEQTLSPASLSSPSGSNFISPSLRDPAITNHPFYKTLSDYLLNDPTFLPGSGLIIFHLENSYPISKFDNLGPIAPYLKGSDRIVYRIAKSLGLDPRVKAKLYLDDPYADEEDKGTVLTSHPGTVKIYRGDYGDHTLVEHFASSKALSNGDVVIAQKTLSDGEVGFKCFKRCECDKRQYSEDVNNMILPWSYVVCLNPDPLAGGREDEDEVCISAMLAIQKELAMRNLTPEKIRELKNLQVRLNQTRYQRKTERKQNPWPDNAWGTQVEKAYMAYGNSSSMEYIYGSGVLVMYVGSWDQETKKRMKAVVFPYAVNRMGKAEGEEV